MPQIKASLERVVLVKRRWAHFEKRETSWQQQENRGGMLQTVFENLKLRPSKASKRFTSEKGMHMLHYFFKKTFRMSANILLSFKLTFTGSWANTFCGLVISLQAAVQLTRPFMSNCWPNQGLWYSLTAEWQPCTCRYLVCKSLQDF